MLRPWKISLTERVDRRRSIPVYQQIVQALIHDIQRGRLLPGTFLPSSRELATTLGVNADDEAALAVGRHRDGRPVLPIAVIKAGADPNDFSFKSDPNAAMCPYHAHIRKTNPRADIPENDLTPRRIIRQGIPFHYEARHR